MIVAILPDPSKAETLLNNLSEADFNLDDVSVVMQDTAMRDKIAKDTGPLKGAKPAQLSAALAKTGTAQSIVQQSSGALKQGKVLVAMQVDPKYQPAALQMFKDISAQIIQE